MVDREETTTTRYANDEAATSHRSETIPTVRDGVADLVGRWRQKHSLRREQYNLNRDQDAQHPPRRKRYTLNLDLDARPALNAEPNAPTEVLDL